MYWCEMRKFCDSFILNRIIKIKRGRNGFATNARSKSAAIDMGHHVIRDVFSADLSGYIKELPDLNK
jgi:hypothetical protein